jgi:hypothetical protein
MVEIRIRHLPETKLKLSNKSGTKNYENIQTGHKDYKRGTQLIMTPLSQSLRK